MKGINPNIQNLIDKIKLAEEIYNRASSRSHNQPMRDQFKTLAKRKNRFLQEIADQFELDLGKHNLKISERIELEWEKAEIEVNHILIHRNERDILKYCIKREEELVDSYEKVLNNGLKNDFLIALFKSQLEDTLRILNELNQTIEAYEFEKNG